MSDSIEVGIEEFSQHPARYLFGSCPVLVVQNGRIVGYYLPFPAEPKPEAIAALASAGRKSDAILQEHGLSEDELLKEFERMREEGRKAKRSVQSVRDE